MSKFAPPGAPPGMPAGPSAPPPLGATTNPTPRGSWKRQTLLILVLIVVLGIVPTALAGNVFGWWTIVLHPPFIVPR